MRPGATARRRSHRAALALRLAAALLGVGTLGGCLTSQVVAAHARNDLIHPPDHRLGGAATPLERDFANDCAAFVLVPLAFVGDVLLFPVQWIGGYRPYGTRDFGGAAEPAKR